MAVGKKTVLSLFECMVRIRSFEERVRAMSLAGLVPGFLHLYAGEEAIAAGMMAVLRPDDYISSTHRGHGHAIAKGADLNLMMAEILGRASGYCKGKGGSMHIAATERGVLGVNGIVGAGMPIGVGAAFACKYQESDRIAVTFFGDGASNRGTFHEALNLASAWGLPIVFLCENNRYGMSCPTSRSMNVARVAERAAGYGIPGVTVDGNDVVAVYEAAREAVDRARRGEGPTLLECVTWRHYGHFVGDPCLNVDPEEHARHLAEDPIPRCAALIVKKRWASQDEVDRIRAAAEAEVEAAVQFATSSPLPGEQQVLTDVYAE